ncbi:cytochrome c-type biogenesis heme exporter protein C [Salmonella enterica subsp. enterica]|uniref:Cytochrome c-type biogenesis heme exporter protein C n=1 Tax=Salmonella enterica I TaxID=59201 RepID=A0A447N5H0_SALET|nr:cytochrome c-type biogenesis heme exporter protein C [Salmonella enterica subsp. enterica]
MSVRWSSLMICTVMTIVASRNRGWLLLPIVYAFALINLAFATFMPNEYITHLKRPQAMMVHIGLSLFSYATLIIAALVCATTGVDRLSVEEQKAGV